MDRSAAASGTAVRAAVKLGRQGIEIAAPGQVVVVGPVVGIDHIVGLERPANPCRDRLLADAEVGGRAHLLLVVDLRETLLAAPDPQHLLEELDLVGVLWCGRDQDVNF